MRRLFTLMVLLALIVGANVVFAGGGKISESDFRDKWPSLMASNAGRDFYFTFPPCYEDGSSGASALMVYVACPVETTVRLEIEGKGSVYTKKTKPNDIVFFRLSPSEGQPFSKTGSQAAPPEAVYNKAAVRVTAGAPIVVYGVVRYQFTSDSFLAIPVTAFGKEYIVASMADMSAMYPGLDLPSETCIVAAYDDTRVTFTLGGNSVTRTTGGMSPGQSRSFTMNRGDVLAFNTNGDEHDLSGSKVTSTKPVGVLSGNQCSNVPTDKPWCDYIVDMELPTNTWGKTYHVWTPHTRLQGCMIKIFAKEPNTKVFRDGQLWKVIAKAGGQEGQGFIYDRNGAGTVDPTVYTSDKPINITIFNPGQSDDNIVSDPFQCVMYPIEQYQKQVIFCTPGNKQSGYSFATNFVALVYELDEGDVIPKDLEFAIPSAGKLNFAPVSARFGGSIGKKFNVQTNGKKYAVKYITLPGDNVYAFRCSKPFACYSYGFSNYDSYGMPTSAALADLTFPDPDAPDPKWTLNCDGSEIEGTVTDLPNIDSLRSRLSEVYLDPQESFNFDDLIITDPFGGIIPGTTIEAKWSIKVTDKSKDAKAVINFSDRRGNDTTITINYYAPNIAITPDTLNFGALKTGESLSKTFTVKNNATGPATISFLELKDKTNLSFTIINNPIPFTLGPGESKDIEVKFEAKSEGVFTNGITFGDTCRKIDRFMRASVGDPQIYADDYDFGARSIGSETQQTLLVYNRGNADLVITDVSAITPDQGVYTWVSPEKPTAANPWVLPVGTQKEFVVSFKPTASITYDPARYVFTSNATKTKSYSELKGIGTQPGLQAAGSTFGRVRIDQNRKRPIAPGEFYTKFKNGSDALVEVFTNGSEPITIKQVVASGVGADKFRYNEADFVGKTLNPGDAPIKSPVTFNPTTLGAHTLELTFITDKKDDKGNDITAKAVVTGEGGGQYLEINGLTFGAIKVGVTTPAKTVTLTNKPHDWDMDVQIDDLVSGDGGIGYDLFGTKGFQLTKSAITLPKVLTPNQSIIIDNCLFQPNDASNVSSDLTTVSDALSEVVSTWTGSGLSGTPDFTLASTQTTVCANSSDFITITVRNTSTGNDKPQLTLDASTITLAGADASQFTVVPFASQTLAADAQGTFQIRFTPTSAGVKSATLQVIASGVTKTITVTSTGTEYPVTFKFDKTGYTFDLNSSTGGWQNVKPVVGYTGANIGNAGVSKIKFVVRYDNLFATPVVKADNTPVINMSGAYTNWTAVATTVTKASNMFEVVVTAPNGASLTSGGGEMFALEFETFIRDTSAKSKTTGELTLSAEALAADNSPNRCAVVTTENSIFRQEDVCVLDFRSILFDGTVFALKAVNPNPVSSAGTEIGFSVGYEAKTELALFNSVGEKVTTLVNQVLRSGEYSLKLDVSSIPSGNYTLKMVSGHVTKSQNVVIVK